MAGLLGRRFADDPGAVGMGSGGLLGPMTGAQKAAMLFAGLRDAVGNFSGRPTENLNSLAEMYGQQNYRQQVRQDRLSDKDEARKAAAQAREDQMEVALSPEEALARGYRPGAVVFRNRLGVERVGQASDLKSPEAIEQQIQIDRGRGIMSPEELEQRLRIAGARRGGVIGVGPSSGVPGLGAGWKLK
jgi:hypothetical protein